MRLPRSAGVPRRPSGTLRPASLAASTSTPLPAGAPRSRTPLRSRSVRMLPGQTRFTVIPSGASSPASVLLRPATPARRLLDRIRFAIGCFTVVDATVTTRRRARMPAGTAAGRGPSAPRSSDYDLYCRQITCRPAGRTPFPVSAGEELLDNGDGDVGALHRQLQGQCSRRLAAGADAVRRLAGVRYMPLDLRSVVQELRGPE